MSKSTSKAPSERSKVTKRILIGVGITLVLVYIVFLFITTNFLGNNNIVTETAYKAKAYDIIESKALVVRDEEYLNAGASGVMVYEVSDGGKVTSDGVVATAYNSQEDVSKVQQSKELDERIAYLKSLNEVNNATNVGIDTLNSQINERMVALMKSINACEYSNMDTVEQNLLTSILRKQLLTGDQKNFDDKIAELESQRASLSTASPIGTVKAGSAGYFVSKVDGYEKSFDVTKLDEVTAKDIESASPEEIGENTYLGKIVKGVNWYLLCPVTHDEATALSHADENIKVRLPSAIDGEIPAKILYVNNNSADNEKAVAVLQCNYMNDALSKLRQENVEIIVNEYEGLKLSKSALHDDDITYTVTDDAGNETEKKERVQGVYVQYGMELVFKQVVIVYAGDEFIIVNETPDRGALLNGTTVSLYDKVVTEGGDLFNGKIIS
ncbi:MAG TPA: hypothetical protein DCY72_00030 [Ruminococcaceae bacterium]|nr:hypothetical protein [Oscillospiraceae bacterium]